MHINYYEPIQDKIPRDIINLFNGFFLKIPKLISYGVEDATLGIFEFEDGLTLYDGCFWCDEHNRKELKEHYLDNYENHTTLTKESVRRFTNEVKENFDIDIQNQDGSYKSFLDYLGELSEKYHELADCDVNE